MPDISKINALAIGSVSKVDGLAKASILDIDGVAVPSAFTGLLDTYTGAAAGYSVRQLKGGVTIAMRVRRETAGGTGDDDEADIAFDTSLTDPAISLDSAISNASAGVTATTLGQFLNVGTVGGTTYSNPDSLTVTAECYVDEWKDQSGNANHATQVTFGSQPQIHSGTVNTDLITENGKPAVYQDGSTYFDPLTLASSVNQNNMGQFAAARWAAASPAFAAICNLYTLTEDDGMSLAYRGDQYVYNDVVFGSHSNDFTQRLHSGYADNASSDVKFYRDGVQRASTTPSSQAHNEFAAGSLGHTISVTRWNGYVQEIILFGTSTKADHSNIETDINGYFSIY